MSGLYAAKRQVRFQLLTVWVQMAWGGVRDSLDPTSHLCGCALLAALAASNARIQTSTQATHVRLEVNTFLEAIRALARDVTRHAHFLNINMSFDSSDIRARVTQQAESTAPAPRVGGSIQPADLHVDVSVDGAPNPKVSCMCSAIRIE